MILFPLAPVALVLKAVSNSSDRELYFRYQRVLKVGDDNSSVLQNSKMLDFLSAAKSLEREHYSPIVTVAKSFPGYTDPFRAHCNLHMDKKFYELRYNYFSQGCPESLWSPLLDKEGINYGDAIELLIKQFGDIPENFISSSDISKALKLLFSAHEGYTNLWSIMHAEEYTDGLLWAYLNQLRNDISAMDKSSPIVLPTVISVADRGRYAKHGEVLQICKDGDSYSISVFNTGPGVNTPYVESEGEGFDMRAYPFVIRGISRESISDSYFLEGLLHRATSSWVDSRNGNIYSYLLESLKGKGNVVDFRTEDSAVNKHTNLSGTCSIKSLLFLLKSHFSPDVYQRLRFVIYWNSWKWAVHAAENATDSGGGDISEDLAYKRYLARLATLRLGRVMDRVVNLNRQFTVESLFKSHFSKEEQENYHKYYSGRF